MQAISNSLWSYSKLGYNPGHRVLDVAARRAAVMLHQYTSQEIANTLWAFATLEQNPGSGMLDAAAMQIARRIEQFSPQVRLQGFAVSRQLPFAAQPASKYSDLTALAAQCVLGAPLVSWTHCSFYIFLVLLRSLLMLHEPISDYHPSMGQTGDSVGHVAAL